VKKSTLDRMNANLDKAIEPPRASAPPKSDNSEAIAQRYAVKPSPESEPVRVANPSVQQTRPSPEPVAVSDVTLSPKRTGSTGEPVRHTDGHTQIINHLLDDILPTLDPPDQVILLRLYRLTRGYRKATCTVSRQKLIAKTRVKKTRLLQGLSTLEDRGYIRRLADDTANSDIALRGMNIEMLIEGSEPVRSANPSTLRTRPPDEPNKLNTQKENTQTQEGVRGGSKFGIEECRRYADHLRSTGQGINNPGGYATTIHRTGEADALIEIYLNPAADTARVDASGCPDCQGSGFYYPGGTSGGVAKCKHERLKDEG
jgi:hypothetical protein